MVETTLINLVSIEINLAMHALETFKVTLHDAHVLTLSVAKLYEYYCHFHQVVL